MQTALALIVVGAFALAGADPYLQLLLWVNGPGALGIIALQALASIAVIVFFVRRRDIARRWYVMPAAIISSLAMIALLVVLVATLNLLTAGGPVVNGVILVTVSLSLVVGIILAVVWRRTRPRVYAQIGGSEVPGE